VNDAERLEAIEKALDDLRVLSEDSIILVEGANDEKALRALGIEGEFIHIQSEGGPLKAAERVHAEGGRAVILTDWDRKGGTLARDAAEQLAALDVEHDTSVRRRLSVLCSSLVKDVESLDSCVRSLDARVRR